MRKVIKINESSGFAKKDKGHREMLTVICIKIFKNRTMPPIVF
jgi:hypothetical protein